jgi:hypothetical protein
MPRALRLACSWPLLFGGGLAEKYLAPGLQANLESRSIPPAAPFFPVQLATLPSLSSKVSDYERVLP